MFRARANLGKLGLARAESCLEVQRALLAAHDARRRASAHVYRHVAGCRDCRELRRRLVAGRRGMAALSPGPLAFVAAGLTARELAGGAATTKLAAGGATGAIVVGGLGLGTHLFRQGEPAPLSIRSIALPHGALAAGDPLPRGTAVVLRTVELEPGVRRHRGLAIACPAGMRVADLLPPDGARLTVTYDRSDVVGASRRAKLVFAPMTLPRRRTVTVGALCKAADARGSLVASGAATARAGGHWAHVRVRSSYLETTPSGSPIGSVHRRQPVWVLRTVSGWQEVVADTGERGWLPPGRLDR